jgi:hypothetical protein
MQYVLLNWSLENPVMKKGSKEELQSSLERLIREGPEHPDSYEIMPYDVYKIAFGLMNDFNKS